MKKVDVTLLDEISNVYNHERTFTSCTCFKKGYYYYKPYMGKCLSLPLTPSDSMINILA